MTEKRHALLIGNQHYPETSGFAPLNSPHNDVRALEKVLKDPTFGRFDEVTVLLDKPYETTLIAIQNALRQKTKNDLLVIYYSGHGKTDDNNNLYLAAPNTRIENLDITSIDARKVAQMMGDSFAEKTVLVLDCCHAGAFPAGFKSDDALQSVADRYANSGGSYVLMACGAYELARDGAEGDLSLLTKHLVEGIGGAADTNQDGIVTVNELTRYLDDIMSRGEGQKFNQSGQNKRGEIVLGWSGRTPVEHVVHQARIALNEWSLAKAISDVDHADVLGYFARLHTEGVDHSDPRWDLVQRVSQKKIGSGEFISGWLRAPAAPAPAPALTKSDAAPATPPEPAPKPRPKPKLKPAPVIDATPKPDELAAVTKAPAGPSFWEEVLDMVLGDTDWLAFLGALVLFGVATAAAPALVYAFWPNLFFEPPFEIRKMELAVFLTSVFVFSIVWTKVHGESEVLDGFELVLPWMIRVAVLTPLSYGLLLLFLPQYAVWIW